MIRLFNQDVSGKAIVLIALQTVLVVLGFIAGARIRFWSDSAQFLQYVQFPTFALQVLAVLIVFQVCFYYSDLYDFSRSGDALWVNVGQSLGAGSLIMGLIYYLLPELMIGRGVFFISLVLIGLSVLVCRAVLDHVWLAVGPSERVLIIGAQDLAVTVARELLQREDLNFKVLGFFDTGNAENRELLDRPVWGNGTDIEAVAQEQRITRIIAALADQRGALPVAQLVRLRVGGIRVEDAQSAMAALTGRVWLHTVKPSWFVFSGGFHRSALTVLMKRTLDLSCGLVGLMLSLPIMLLVAIAIRLDSKGPVIYRQVRVGLRGRTFQLLKFRSMRVDAERGTGAQWAKKDDPRLTRLGKYLRQFRLDELPQFINVVRGDMSFVGPRPERPVFVEQLRQVISYYDERHSVRPGLTGWAQVQYPYGSSVEDAFRKLEYELFYLKNMSIAFDLLIMLQTIRTVLTGSGAR